MMGKLLDLLQKNNGGMALKELANAGVKEVLNHPESNAKHLHALI